MLPQGGTGFSLCESGKIQRLIVACHEQPGTQIDADDYDPKWDIASDCEIDKYCLCHNKKDSVCRTFFGFYLSYHLCSISRIILLEDES